MILPSWCGGSGGGLFNMDEPDIQDFRFSLPENRAPKTGKILSIRFIHVN